VRRDELTRRLADRLVQERLDNGGPVVLGLTGADASGKSRLAGSLARHLDDRGVENQLVHVDDFHRPRSERYAGRRPEPEQYLHQSIDLEALVREVLGPIRRDGQLRHTARHLDLLTDGYTTERTYRVTERTIVLVEGVFLLREPVRSYLDLIVVLTADEEELVARGSQRDELVQGADAERRFREKYLPAQRALFAAHPPEQLADIIIDNTNWERPRVVRWGPR
jgi:uridine kinase